jgi:hypothetical protein
MFTVYEIIEDNDNCTVYKNVTDEVLIHDRN